MNLRTVTHLLLTFAVAAVTATADQPPQTTGSASQPQARPENHDQPAVEILDGLMPLLDGQLPEDIGETLPPKDKRFAEVQAADLIAVVLGEKDPPTPHKGRPEDQHAALAWFLWKTSGPARKPERELRDQRLRDSLADRILRKLRGLRKNSEAQPSQYVRLASFLGPLAARSAIRQLLDTEGDLDSCYAQALLRGLRECGGLRDVPYLLDLARRHRSSVGRQECFRTLSILTGQRMLTADGRHLPLGFREWWHWRPAKGMLSRAEVIKMAAKSPPTGFSYTNRPVADLHHLVFFSQAVAKWFPPCSWPKETPSMQPREPLSIRDRISDRPALPSTEEWDREIEKAEGMPVKGADGTWVDRWVGRAESYPVAWLEVPGKSKTIRNVWVFSGATIIRGSGDDAWVLDPRLLIDARTSKRVKVKGFFLTVWRKGTPQSGTEKPARRVPLTTAPR